MPWRRLCPPWATIWTFVFTTRVGRLPPYLLRDMRQPAPLDGRPCRPGFSEGQFSFQPACATHCGTKPGSGDDQARTYGGFVPSS